MKKILLYFCAFTLLSLYSNAQPQGIDDSIMSIRRKWKAGSTSIGAHDPILKPSQFPLIFKKTDAISSLTLQTFPEVRGADPSWYVTIHGKPYFEGAPSPYQYNCMFKYYFYSKGLKKIIRHEEPFTGASVYVNAFRFLLDSTHLVADINGVQEKIYEVCNTESEWKGYPVYKIMDNSYKNYKMILLTKEGSLPFKPVSQLQYLQAYRKMRLQETKEITDKMDMAIAKGKADIQKMKNDKYYATAQGQNLIAAAQNTLDTHMSKRDANIKSATDLLNKDLKKIEDYMNQVSPETLQQQAVVKINKGHKIWNGFADASDKNSQKIVYVDRGYFDKTIPSYEIQFITLAWYWMDATASLHFKNEFENKYPVEKLQAMVKGHAYSSQKPIDAKHQMIDDIKTIVKGTSGPNDQATWTSVINNINNYLIQKWKEGRLHGTTSSQAFYIRADRTTMTENDINSGKLIVEVGVASTKPAEFEILRIEHQL